MMLLEVKSIILDLITEALFGVRLRVQIGDSLYPALISKNTRYGEGKYRITWFDPKKGMSPINHLDFDKETLDYIFANKKLPPKLTNWYITYNLPMPQLVFEGKTPRGEQNIIVGIIDEFGEITAKKSLPGRPEVTHAILHGRGYSREGYDWRFNELTDRVYWKEKHAEKYEELVDEWLWKRGYTPRQHITFDNITSNRELYDKLWDEAHGLYHDELKETINELKVPTSDAFKRWFSGSKIVDEHGNPLIVYHGTDREISAFDFDYAGSRDTGFYGKGMYFTPDPEYAGYYPLVHAIQTRHHFKAGSRPEYGKNIIPVYLRILNPLVIDQPSKLYNLVKTDKGAEITEKLKKMGYDGVVKLGSGRVNPEQKGKIVEIVAFYPNQIKSAIGSEYGPGPELTK